MKNAKLGILLLASALAGFLNAQSTPNVTPTDETQNLSAGPIGGDPPADVPPPTLDMNPENRVELSLYPNPGKGSLNIIAPAGKKSIQVYNLIGNLKTNLELEFQEGQATRINLEHLAAGIYLVKIGDRVLRYQKS